MFRKTVLLVTGTVAGVVGVVGYNPPHLDAAIAPTGTNSIPETTDPAPAVKSNNSAKSKSTTKPAAKKVQTAAVDQNVNQTASQQPSQSSGVSGVFQGDTSQNRWGPVQVEIIVADGKITNVSTLQYPSGDRKSLNISNQVLPWLQQEVLRAQSGNITGVSGATYTSNSFKSSLASALQKAGL